MTGPALASLLVGSAWAAPPTFTGTEADVALAGELWVAAVACAGWEPTTAPSVPITRVEDLPHGFVGLARGSREGGLETIRLVREAPAVVLAHEIGHAWFHADGAALNEGRAEVLAECVARALPDRVRFLRADDYLADHLEDLRTWTDAWETAGRVNHAQYTGAWRLFRTIDGVVPDHAVLAPEVHAWDDVLALLDGAGPGGRQVADAIRGGVETQRAGLDDLDRDDLVTLQERLLGLDPTRWDTDGDGWWDGAPADHPPHAAPLRLDGAAVCLPFAPASGPLDVAYGGRVRGLDVTVVGSARGTTDAGSLERTSLFRAPLMASQRGGYWVEARGEEIGPNPRCRVTAGATVVDRAPGAPAGLDVFAEALGRAQVAVGRATRPAERRLLVVLGSEAEALRMPATPDVREHTVEVPVAAWRAAAADPAEVEALAFHVAVLQRLAETPALAMDASVANALREDLLGRKGTIWGETWRGEVKRWQKVAAGCPSWEEVLDGDCP